METAAGTRAVRRISPQTAHRQENSARYFAYESARVAALLVSQCNHRIDATCSSRGNEGGRHCNKTYHHRDRPERWEVSRADSKQQVRQHSGQHEGAGESDAQKLGVPPGRIAWENSGYEVWPPRGRRRAVAGP